jgi:hypothetical protein
MQYAFDSMLSPQELLENSIERLSRLMDAIPPKVICFLHAIGLAD